MKNPRVVVAQRSANHEYIAIAPFFAANGPQTLPSPDCRRGSMIAIALCRSYFAVSDSKDARD